MSMWLKRRGQWRFMPLPAVEGSKQSPAYPALVLVMVMTALGALLQNRLSTRCTQNAALAQERIVDLEVVGSIHLAIEVQIAIAIRVPIVQEPAVLQEVVGSIHLPVEVQITIVGVLHNDRVGVGRGSIEIGDDRSTASTLVIDGIGQ